MPGKRRLYAKNLNKFNANKTTVNGIEFASQKEAKRYWELYLMQRAGKIEGLECQKKYVLIPTQREESNQLYTRGAKKGSYKPGKVIEKEASYIADFDYYENGVHVVEDVKGHKKGAAYELYVLKRKLMLKEYGIRVIEI